MNRTWLDWRPALSLWQGAEVILMSLIAFGLMFWVRPQDPLSLGGGFPWAWLAPVLLALRYGMPAGLLSVVILVSLWLLSGQTGLLDGDFPKTTFLGGLIVTMICGEFSGLWRHRLRRQTELNSYLGQRLEELTREHYLLKLSHDRLEQNLISRPYTLRGALAELRDLLKSADSREGLPAAAEFLSLAAAHCQLTTASLHPAENEQPRPAPLAACGGPSALDADDPLVKHALEHRSLAYASQKPELAEKDSRYLLAAPIYRRSGLAGLLVVEQMPFFAFHQDTLQTLAALVSYYSDAIDTQSAQDILQRYPDCPPGFAQHLDRLAGVQEASGVSSHLAILRFPDDERGREIRRRLSQSKRELDFYWLRDTPQPLLIGLFPITGEDGMQGYLARIDAWLTAEYGAEHRELGIRYGTEPLRPGKTLGLLQEQIPHAV